MKYKYNLLIYNDDEIHYIEADLLETNIEPIFVGDEIYGRTTTFITKELGDKETVKLDETLMRRIAKYNKEKDLEKIDQKIKQKEIKLKELEEKIEDREKRWELIKNYVANIYDIDLSNDYENEEYWED